MPAPINLSLMEGICKLCSHRGKLEESHIIPAFLYKWLKETSGTGFLRFGESPNLRSQDGFKEHWLCSSCEDLFSKWESLFASEIFYPLVEGNASNFRYQDWLLKFAVSTSWRALLFIKETAGISYFPNHLATEAENAIAQWEKFLLGKSPHPDEYEQHMLPLGVISSFTDEKIPTNINRYLLRSIDLDAVCSPTEAFVYVKLPYVLSIGFIHVKRPRDWQGTKVHVERGTLGSERYVLPAKVGDYILGQARMAKEVQDSISKVQKAKIEESLWKGIDRTSDSGSFKAMQADVALFGRAAFADEEQNS